MIRGRLLPPGADIAQALRVRAAVFGQGAADETDAQSWHALVYDRVDENGEPVGDACGAGRIWWQDGAFHIGRVAVMPDRRGLGLGDLIRRQQEGGAGIGGDGVVLLAALQGLQL